MTRDRFMTLRFKAYMELTYYSNNRAQLEEHGELPVMLLACDFDNDTVKVIPFPEGWADEKEFWTSIDHIELPTKRMKVLK